MQPQRVFARVPNDRRETSVIRMEILTLLILFEMIPLRKCKNRLFWDCLILYSLYTKARFTLDP